MFLPESKVSCLRRTLDARYASRSPGHLANDPLSFCHRYSRPEDREIAALISSVFAYGAVKVIKGSLKRIFAETGDSLSGFIDRFNPELHAVAFDGFRHRFNDARDLGCLLWAIRIMRERCGSIEQFFADSSKGENMPLDDRINRFCSAVLALDYSPVTGSASLPADSYFRFMFPLPAGGSCCKRLCMFLRWVVRPADGIDLGLWKAVCPSELFIPVDVHIARIARHLGLTARRHPDWKMTREITESLRLLDPDDPVKYDFPICHLGISEGCDGKAGDACAVCPIAVHCAVCSV